jgi:hypothetical protein
MIDGYNLISEKLRDVALALQALNKRVNAEHLYQEVMKGEEYDKFIFAFAFDHLNGDEKIARGFMVKDAKLKKFWLDNFFKNHGN